MKTEYYFKLIDGEELHAHNFSFVTENGSHFGGVRDYNIAVHHLLRDNFGGIHVTERFGDITSSIRFIPTRSIISIYRIQE